MNVTIVVGNPKARSRTYQAAKLVAEKLTDRPADLVIDLADLGAALLDWSSVEVADLVDSVVSSSMVIFASPTFKGTYTGLLKGFLDRYPALGLRDVCAIPVMTGADKGHSMAPEVNLRPLLVELGALVPTRALYFETPAMYRLDEVLTEWLADNAVAVRQILMTAASTASAR